MSDDAEQFALEHCRAIEIDPMDRYLIFDLKDDVVAVMSLSNYYDVIRLIPELPYTMKKAYTRAVAERCVSLVRSQLATAHEFDLR